MTGHAGDRPAVPGHVRFSRFVGDTVPLVLRMTLFGLLVLLLAGMMVLEKVEQPVLERVRLVVVDVVAGPLADAAGSLSLRLAGVIGTVREMFYLREDNARLREENGRLSRRLLAASWLEAENARLRQLRRMVSDRDIAFVTARVTARGNVHFVQDLLLAAGTGDGLGENAAVLGPVGMVGRIHDPGERFSRVILLTDVRSRVPVVLETSGRRGILAGTGEKRPVLKYVFGADVSGQENGEIVRTAGSGSVLPPGLPVGRVETGEDGGLRVRLFENPDTLLLARVVLYHRPARTVE